MQPIAREIKICIDGHPYNTPATPALDPKSVRNGFHLAESRPFVSNPRGN